MIHSTALINSNVIIEDDVYIGPYCIIGFDPEWKGHEKDNQGVIIRSGTRITGHVTIDGGGLFTFNFNCSCNILDCIIFMYLVLF
jgi:acyl-[acyl carrier protein]--UDP-N-acetylglucosamine O-acyltransferase